MLQAAVAANLLRGSGCMLPDGLRYGLDRSERTSWEPHHAFSPAEFPHVVILQKHLTVVDDDYIHSEMSAYRSVF